MAITKPELKKRVLKYLNKNGDTFTDITSTLLNTGIDQHNIKYLLDELQHDGLIILSKANPHLNSNQHVLNAASVSSPENWAIQKFPFQSISKSK